MRAIQSRVLYPFFVLAVFVLTANLAAVSSGKPAAVERSAQRNSDGPQSLVLGPRTPVNPPLLGYHGEVMIVADPTSENNLIVCGFRSNERTGSAYEGYVYHSADGGRTWREALVDASSQWVSEESCAFGPGHQAYFLTGVSDTSGGEPRHEYGTMHLYRSADGGKKWRSVLIRDFMDWTAMAVDWTAGPNRNNLYIFANAVSGGPEGLSMSRNPFLAVFRDFPALSFSLAAREIDPAQDQSSYPGKYPTAALVLNNGSVLTAFSGARESAELRQEVGRVFSVELGISKDAGKTLQKSVVYESPNSVAVAGAALDKANGEIYLCWTQDDNRRPSTRLMLASSKDNGGSWSTNPVRFPERADSDLQPANVSIAVNDAGVLGFMWYGKSSDRVYFGSSFDEGKSIAKVAVLTGDQRIGTLPSAADDRRLFVFPPTWNAASHHLDPLKILALGPRPAGIPFGTSLATDRQGRFHAVWSEVANGPTSLWTRTIAAKAASNSEAAATLAELDDLSARVSFHISNIRYDHLYKLVAFDLSVTNQSEATLGGPMWIVMSSDQPDLSAYNADNQNSRGGAVWKLQLPLSGLACEHETEPRTLTFRINDANGSHELMNVPLKIYGRVQ